MFHREFVRPENNLNLAISNRPVDEGGRFLARGKRVIDEEWARGGGGRRVGGPCARRSSPTTTRDP